MQMKWWEKTIEYLFVIESALLGKFNLSPLDGTHELAGDLIASENSKFILIEFKADYTSIASEKKTKFEEGQYDEAKDQLSGHDDHHLIVYGAESTESPGQLILFAQTYFSEKAKAVRDIYSNGTEIGYFHSYLQHYLEFKKISQKASGGGRSLNFAMVAAVDSETGKASAISLDEYFLSLNLKLVKEQTKTYSSTFDM